MTQAQELLPTIGQKIWIRFKEYHHRTGIPRQFIFFLIRVIGPLSNEFEKI